MELNIQDFFTEPYTDPDSVVGIEPIDIDHIAEKFDETSDSF